MAVGKMDQPTGPSGILSSSRPQSKAGGKSTVPSKPGFLKSPGAKMPAASKRMGRR
jgi:hypothetical protein